MTQTELARHLAALRQREAAAVQLLGSKPKSCNKCPDKAAKLPETERERLMLVRKWEARHKVKPSDFTKVKLDKARARLANTQWQMIKLARNIFADELIALRKEITKVEKALVKLEQANDTEQKTLSVLLTELYDIDNITGDITKRVTGMPIRSPTIMVKGNRLSINKARQLLLAGGLV